MSDVVRVRYIATDRAFVSDVFAVLGVVFSDIPPAATMVIAGLVPTVDTIQPEVKVEIEAMAYRPA
jgi:enamine deaminase RidA (YjgF/YER057c/UK114 family)